MAKQVRLDDVGVLVLLVRVVRLVADAGRERELCDDVEALCSLVA